ncbi:MAG: ABC transporter ATP-binding protein [Erysipelotrichaceae bacterium]|nr:ABC transporter ATP-binding protein [Erysipelotrichaceae bacterium]
MNKDRSNLAIMKALIVLVKPLWLIMFVAILFGVLGFLSAIFISILGSGALFGIIDEYIGVGRIIFTKLTVSNLLFLMIFVALIRGFLHYIEQYCNHYTAFKLLAIIRHQVFNALRRLAPAKLEVKDRGNLISLITSDIELLEVFYAHTISPIIIAIVTSLIMVLFMAQYSMYAAILALIAYTTVGLIIPIINTKIGADHGDKLRHDIGELNSYVLESLRGLDEVIIYGHGDQRLENINKYSEKLNSLQHQFNRQMSWQTSFTTLAVLGFSILMLGLMITQFQQHQVVYEGLVICTVAMMASFGPVIALSSLSNNLHHTLASARRVLDILDEQPQVKDIEDNGIIIDDINKISLTDVDFAYDQELILNNLKMKFKHNHIYGIYGPSGLGKSTILKLLMRFWEVDHGAIKINEHNLNDIPTTNLRRLESYVTQETQLFNDTIFNNIAIGKLNASTDEVITAAKKAAIHDFIIQLKDGYQSKVGELGDKLSGGEKQRIGLARAFLHNSKIMLLDEPTSNLDALNEGIILKSLKDASDDKTIILVTHRASTLNIADEKISIDTIRKP